MGEFGHWWAPGAVVLLTRLALAETAESKLYREVACGDQEVRTEHCREVRAQFDRYRSGPLPKFQVFFSSHEPKDLPAEVVYPFAGGDLLTALAVYPDASVYTTLSLEPAAGPESTFDAPDLKQLRTLLESLLEEGHERTEVLEQPTKLPAVLAMGLAGLAAHHQELVSSRYIDLSPKGAVVPSRSRGQVEVTFRPQGQPQAPLRTWRHFFANLDDAHLKADSPLLAHLKAKGRVAVLVKAAGRPVKSFPDSSIMLWAGSFSRLRSYLLNHLDWMVSDCTGPPPRWVRQAGLIQQPFGRFEGLLGGEADHGQDLDDLLELFAKSPPRKLPFRLGYPDRYSYNHLIITKRRDPAPTPK